MSKIKDISKLQNKISLYTNFLNGEITQLINADYSDTIENAKYKDEKIFRFRKRVQRLNYLFDKLKEEIQK